MLQQEDDMDLQFDDIQETALITLAIRASETSRPNPRIRDPKAKEIIDALGTFTPCVTPCIRRLAEKRKERLFEKCSDNCFSL